MDTDTQRDYLRQYTAVRRIQFCAGHRVFKHESKCQHLHGHNYIAFFHAEPTNGLDSLGRVMDFFELKQRLGAWIEKHWDHGMILWSEDQEAIAIMKRLSAQKIYIMQSNPTAENMALELLESAAPAVLSDTGIEITKVVLWETENCYAEVTSHSMAKRL